MKRGLIAGVVLALLAPRSAAAFDFFEHEYIAEVACRVLTRQNASPCRCTQAATTQSTTFTGRLCVVPRHVALAGDHARDERGLARQEEDEDLEAAVQRQQQEVFAWLSTGPRRWADLLAADVDDLRKVFDLKPGPERLTGLGYLLQREVYIEHRRAHPRDPSANRPTIDPLDDRAHTTLDALAQKRPACFVPTKALEDAFAGLRGYAELALRNEDHFGWPAQQAYRQHHQRGWYDAKAEAFALHFLMDLYSAGHVRVERGALAPYPAKYQHDWDSRNGLAVGQSFYFPLAPTEAGQPRYDWYVVYWRAYGDRCLLRDEGRATRLLAAFAAIHSLEHVSSPQLPDSDSPPATITWTRPIAIEKGNSAVRDEHREHFEVTLGLGALVPLAREPAKHLLRTHIGMEYYPPLAKRLMLTAEIAFSTSRQVTLSPIGVGFHGDFVLTKLSPAIRWATDRDLLEAGLQLQAGWGWSPFVPLELRAVANGTPFFNWSRPGFSVDYDIEVFLQLVYRLDR